MEGVTIEDLEPNTERLKGLPLRIVTQLVKDYPALIGMISGGGLSAEAVIEQGPKAVEIIIAAGWGKPDDAEAMRDAGDLELPEQIRLISAIITKTLGGGAGPFSDLIRLLYEPFRVPKDQMEKAAKLEIVKDRLAKMQQKPSPSSEQKEDSPKQKFGT